MQEKGISYSGGAKVQAVRIQHTKKVQQQSDRADDTLALTEKRYPAGGEFGNQDTPTDGQIDKQGNETEQGEGNS